MKLKLSRMLAAAAALALAALGTAAHARDNIHWSVGIQAAPVHVGVGNAYPVVVAPPVYVAPPPVYYQPAPVYVAPQPVYYSRPSPVYYDHGYRHGHGHRHGGRHGGHRNHRH
jgi:hypothetical protein